VGRCCGGRSYDVSYTDDALYGQLEGQIGRLNLDASVRYDSVKAGGVAYAPSRSPTSP
jgi:outer membrane cobalamin receptor